MQLSLKTYRLLGIFMFLIQISCLAQEATQDTTFVSRDMQINKFVQGTLISPISDSIRVPLVIFIMGQGLTDRNGNQSHSKNNAFKHLATGLSEQGVASFRYDKRIFNKNVSELQIRFDDFIDDAISVIEHFILEPRYTKIIVAGHDQGSLIGMVATQQRADAFISIAGASQTIDKMIVDQLQRQAPGLVYNAKLAFRQLTEMGKARNYSKALKMIFRPDMQQFMRSWMLFDPVEELKKIDVPIMILQGDRDMQIDVKEAKILVEATPFAKYVEIKNMNHYLKEIKGSDIENQKSYNEPNRPVAPKAIKVIADFAKEEKL